MSVPKCLTTAHLGDEPCSDDCLVVPRKSTCFERAHIGPCKESSCPFKAFPVKSEACIKESKIVSKLTFSF